MLSSNYKCNAVDNYFVLSLLFCWLFTVCYGVYRC